ncbi:histidine kinase [Reichenbachiella agariperforans]|uniref:histidine kinase n=1 Tax=Reichenbachiella agariperforans TaxID=156994 RepID=A0A1M6T0N7_REIAG|nr:HAMP domain-containing sensor histidine kinase [Reichenbachiella agariperforans]SHK50368.1 histidine kinase [Reichenbachiella agariperforans]
MTQLSDEQLLEELKARFAEKNELLQEQKRFMADLKVVNDKLLQSERLKSQFLSNIKNEINNPMTSIMGLLRLNLSGHLSPEAWVKNTKLVYQEASALNFQLRNLFMAAELEAGDAQLELGQFTCVEVIGEAIAMVQNQLNDCQVTCRVDADVNEILYSDRNKVLMILSNLISNAHKFSDPETGEIEIELSRNAEDHLVFVIRDNGVGISDADRATIYDRFNQLEGGTTKTYGGHGLGLSIVHALVDMLDGTMQIDSALGEGTVATVRLSSVTSEGNLSLFDEDDFELFSDSSEESF